MKCLSPTAPARRHGALLLAVLLAGACARSTPAAPPSPAAVSFTRLADSSIGAPPLHRAHIGVVVYDPASERVLYAHNAERHFVPASNQKYWPTATALHLLGPDFRYRTPISGIGFDGGTGTARALLVQGRGDPTWSQRFHDDDLAVLGFLADSLVAAGLQRVTGDLVVDATWFDESLIPGTWTFGNLNGTSAPPTGAFVVGEGIVRVVVEPDSTIGAPARVTPRAPDGLVPVVNRVVTRDAGTDRRVSTSRGPWNDTLRLSGLMALEAEPQTLRLPMTDPVRFAAEAFAGALRERGVTLEGGVRVVRDSTEAAAVRAGRPATAMDGGALPVRELASWTSPPMSEIVTAILQPSQNWMAEQLVRTLGAEKGEGGGWRPGIEVAEDFLFGTVGIDSAALSMQDGSGMSHQNLVTPHAVVQLLAHARTAPWSQVFRDALTGPGRPGTLSNRLQGLEGRVTGKTGTLSNVNALSGYVTTHDGRELIFSILSNASGLGSATVVPAIDRMVEALANGVVPR
jgi:serine-type D-Ala-D-Ala carboxypeptidase/endopeptidase (penicillin-binding protein 4)